MLKAVASVLLAIVLLLFVGFDIAITLFIEIDGDPQAVVVVGILVSQVTLLAVWSALAPFSIGVRIGSGVAAISLVSLAMLISMPHHELPSLAWSLAAVTIVMWIAIQIPLWLMRSVGGWQLGLSKQATANQQSTQFKLRQLLIWTAAFGAWLGIARWIAPIDLDDRSGEDWPMAVVLFFLLLGFNSLIALQIAWAALAPRFVSWRLLVAAIFWAALSYAQVILFDGARGDTAGTSIFPALNAIHFAGAMVPLLLLRFCGVRLVRGISDSGSTQWSPLDGAAAAESPSHTVTPLPTASSCCHPAALRR